MSTKHRPRPLIPASEIGSSTLREVPLPSRILKAVHESNAVVLGAREPEDGRYKSSVRSNFIRPEAQPVKPGESAQTLSGPLEMNVERHKRAVDMNTRNFRFGYEGVELPIISELRGAQQTAVDLLKQQQVAERRNQNSPAPYTSPQRGAKPSAYQERQAHVDRMRASHVFAGPVATETAAIMAGRGPEINSTQRSSYVGHDANSVQEQRAGAAMLRKVQTTTSWAAPPNTSAKDWVSVKESTMFGAPGSAAELSKQNLTTCVNIGSAAVSTKDTLRSLKQIDFVPHKAQPVPPPVFTAHEDHFVLGYLPRDVDSTSRVSYTPTVFVAPDKPPALRSLTPAAAASGTAPKGAAAPAARRW